MKFNILFLAELSYAFGRIGHYLTGKVAQRLLTPAGKTLLASIIPEFNGNLGNACNWGDVIKSNRSYDWAKPLHYINPRNDDPPRACVYEPGADCPEGVCVVSAIRNYTFQFLKTNTNRNEALKFLVHFIGDLHQPLHATGRDRGGTKAQVRFNNRVTSLHAVWDSLMFQDDFYGSSDLYTDSIIRSIGVTWRSEIDDWLACPSPFHIQSTTPRFRKGLAFKVESIDQILCPEVWAKFSNTVNCLNVWPGFKRKWELSGQYYQDNIQIEEKLLAQSAVRMAAIINFGASLQ